VVTDRAATVSVVVPCYNRADLVGQTLRSLLNQTLPADEIIVVDDGSTDSTVDAVESEFTAFSRQFSGKGKLPEFKVIRQQNAGPGAARNLGAREARGEYLAFLDSDDLWFPWTLEFYKQVIEQEKSPGFVAGCPFVFEATSQSQAVAQGHLQTKTYSDYLASGDERRWWGVSSFVVKKSLFEKAGGFASEFVNGEDADFVMKCGTEPGFVQVVCPLTFGYRKHEANITKAFEKNLAGARLQIRNERMGIYPGGKPRERERWHILSRQIRPVAVAAVEDGNPAAAWEIYKATFRWHLKLRKWKFLLGLPVAIITRAVRMA
jgi:glycosyltransferase involved in cell wall biosynthesis